MSFYADKIYDKETKDKLLDIYIENLNTSVNVIDSIAEVVKAFNGKVYNRRFDNKLEELLAGKELKDKIYPKITLDCNRLEIELSFWNNRSFSGKSCCYYLPSSYDKVRIAYIWSDFSRYGDKEENKVYYDEKSEGDKLYFWIDSNYNYRIKSSAIVSSLMEHKAKIIEEIAMLEEKRQKVQEYVDRLNAIKAELSNLQEEIPYTLKDFYEIKSYANWQ